MDSIELQELIRGGEDLHTDFKERLGSPSELAKDIVCFANTDGGQLLVGVADDGTVVGIDDSDAVHRAVDNTAYNNCQPPVTVVQEVVEIEAHQVVVVRIPKGSRRPYRTNKGRYYVRTTSGCRDASREELLRLFQASQSLFYDETPLVHLGPETLDLGAFRHYLELTGQAELELEEEHLLRNWGLAANGHPTIAGLLLFGFDPQRHLPFAQINAARIPGTDVSADPLDRKDCTGRLLDVVEQAERFCYLHLPIPHEIRGFEPEPRPELPSAVMREAIVNAVAHRDYTVHGPIRIFILDDRIEIHTPGRAPNSVDEGAMRNGVHVVRNPRIYARLSDAGLTTRAGTGIRRILRLVREAVGREVEIVLRDFEVLLAIPRPVKR